MCIGDTYKATANIGTVPPTIESEQEVTKTITSPPDSWYETITVTTPPTAPITIPSGSTYTPGNFINLDYGFQVYFPNVGDFYGDGGYGLGTTSRDRGKGFIDDMNTTEWTRRKTATFDFRVIYDGVAYSPQEEIDLVVDRDTHDFYCPLANYEAISAGVTFKAYATNGTSLDNDLPANRARGNQFDAKHSGVRQYNIDVVGRVGNLTMLDTGDYRFANFFKQAKSPVSWIIPNVVKDVELTAQNKVIGSGIDIRGVTASASTKWLNTYGTVPHLARIPNKFPLSPDLNTVVALRNQPLRIGYNQYMDIQTIGNYAQGGIQIIPYYYHLNLVTGVVKPVDVYMQVGSEYKPINLFGNAVPGWNPNSVYDNFYTLNWEAEFGRRGYTSAESTLTKEVSEYWKVWDANGNVINMPTPQGQSHAFGNNQLIQLTQRNRTFIGSPVILILQLRIL
ncbi:MAG: hypothetical protein PHC56_11585 [Herbinix sp.]|nr:hypothetical protein [Herbinix sp.]